MKKVINFKNGLLTALTAICFSSVLAIFSVSAVTASAETDLTAGRTQVQDAITGMNLSLSQDITTRFYATVPAGATDVKMAFLFKEDLRYADGEATQNENEYVFSYNGVTAQHFDEEIQATLLYTLDGVEYYDVATKTVQSYAETLLSKTADEMEMTVENYTKMAQLAADLLNYGAAAQDYTSDDGAKVNTNVATLLAANSVTDTTFTAPTQTDAKFEGNADANNDFTGAGLRFDYNVAMFIKFKAEDGVTLTAKKGDNAAETLTATASGEGYVAYYGVSATEFDTPVVFQLVKDGNAVGRSFTYSVRSFVANNQSMVLAQEVYQYGQSAVAYGGDHAHTYGEGVTLPATCEKAGSTTYTCSVCGYDKVTVISATGHAIVASEETIGTQTLYCANACGEFETLSPDVYHNVTLADQCSTNDGYYLYNGNKGTADRTNLSYATTAKASANVKKATEKSYNGDYVGQFYTGAGIHYVWEDVAVPTTLTVVLKAAPLSWESTGSATNPNWDTRDMQFNLIFDVTMNDAVIDFDDSVILKGSTEKGDYGVAATWTYVVFDVELQEGDNELKFISKTPLVDGKPLYADGTAVDSTQSSPIVDTLAIYGEPHMGDIDFDLSNTVKTFTHNFTAADQTAQNNCNPPQERYDLNYIQAATATANPKKAALLATNEDYVSRFYGGAAVTKTFNSTVAGKATVTFKIASGYLTNGIIETGDMVVNKVMKFTVNGTDVVLSDDVVLKGDTTKQSYACMGVWTEITFEMDVKVGANSIVLTSLFPDDGTGNPLYKDPGVYGTQSTFQLDTVSVTLK